MNKKGKNSKLPKPLKDLTLLDRFLFDAAMSKPEICHNVLSIIFNDKEVPSIHFGITEKTLEPYYNSRAVRIFLNTRGENDEEVSEELVEMLHYIEETSDLNQELHSSRVRELAKQIEQLKCNQEVGVKHMRFWEEMTYAKDEAKAEGRAEGRAEGLEEGKIKSIYESVQNLQESLSLTLEQALAALKVSESEWESYISYLNKDN